ncbi:multi-component transcriptional regulator, winged helix family [Richelia sinica FACHB-800]|uniref:histidine kinase n=1 Tax=Richelia sinica FACHB-800 TaxID=1357546 RepID=A0A975T9Z9_9NOST|nr:response regulator [Richelia sinica]MBD2666567.1 response regulator [Richelia sinica FACHB-800]QXE24188.1 multi-component transcriptional regulator, winged helix family [Richelia sinica FACHB-800]
MKILIVEDDELNAYALTAVLAEQNYAVEVANDGNVAWDLITTYDYDLILLDVLLPKLDGISLCRKIRASGRTLPILLLTGCDSSHEKAIGLDAGADDYVVKPFDQEELVARVRALLRRGGIAAQPILEWGNLRLDPSSCEVSYGAKNLSLTPKEYALLELFMRNNRRVFSCGMILEHLWSYEDTPGEEAVRTHIKGLRMKLRSAGASSDLIETVYGIGYRLKPLEEEGVKKTKEYKKKNHQKIDQAITDIWQKFRGRVAEQLQIIEQATVASQNKNLTPELRQMAVKEAHTLAGSLGTFGLPLGSEVAHKIEKLLKSNSSLKSTDISNLEKWFNLLKQEVENKEETTIPEVLQLPENTPHQEAKILVVDDDPQILALLQTLLHPWGLRAIALSDPRQFWPTLANVQPDMLVLDVEMPYTNGIQLCQEVRNDPQWSELPILFLTVHNDGEIVNQVFSVGADDFVSKPIIGPELVTRIINRLERVKLLKRMAQAQNSQTTETKNKTANSANLELKSVHLISQEIARINRTLQTLSACNQALVRAENEDNLLHQICQIIVEVGGYRFAWVGFAENNLEKSIRPVAYAGYDAGYLQSLNLTWADTEYGRGPTGRAIRTGKTCIVQNIAGDANYLSWQAQASQRGYAASIALPLVLDHLQPLGALNIYSTTTDTFDTEEVNMLQELADDLAYGIVALRNRHKRRLAEIELQQSKESYQQLVELCPEAIFIIDHQENFIFLNSAAVQLLGNSNPQAILGKNLLDIVHPQSQEIIAHNIQILKTLKNSVPLQEVQFLKLDGTVIYLEIVAAAFIYQGQTAAQIVARDITLRKQTELALHQANNELELRVAERTAELITVNHQLQSELDERKRTQEELRISQTRFERILSIADDAIISIDGQQQITLFNQGAEKIFGYSSAEIMGKKLDVLLPMRFAEVHRQYVKDFGQGTNLARRMGERREIFGIRRDGSEFPAEASISKLDIGEEFVYTVILRDITERKQIEKMKDEFVSVVSHELRTPLTSIHGSLGMLASGLLSTDSEQGKRLLQIATDSTERLVRLINDILDIERIESGKVKMEKEICHLDDLIDSALDVMQSLAAKANVQLSINSISAQIWADPDRIVQTLTNLLSNAIKFSHPGSTVWLTASKEADNLLFMVKDTGRGIPADKLDSIFERFQQVDSSDSRNHDGTGLGLAICQSIVQQHSGRIWVESELGVGSSFYFTLPMMESYPEPSINLTEMDAVNLQQPFNQPINSQYSPLVLVCDDDSVIRNELRHLLEKGGYQVMTVATGEEAIATSVAHHPDVILLDLLMPGMNGWETMAVLKEQPDTQDIPIVICSVYKPNKTNPANAEFVDWLSKPVEEISLLHSLREVVVEPSRKMRILIVEDDHDLADLLATVFERHDIETFLAKTGREAIHLSQKINPDLLILDLILPEADGFAVVDWLRQHNQLYSIPMVVYSAKDLDESERHRLKLGYTEFLTKGRVTTQEFEHRVMELLQRITHQI